MLRNTHQFKKKTFKYLILGSNGLLGKELKKILPPAKTLCIARNASDINIDLINVGSGVEISIKELAEKIKLTIGFNGKLNFDSKMPDGNPRKLLDSSLINKNGWFPKIDLDQGLKDTYSWYLENS